MLTGVPSGLTNRSSGTPGQPSARPASGVSGRTASGPDGGFAEGGTMRGKGVRWRNPPGPVDRAEQRHEDRERPDRLESVRVRGEAAHRVERHRIAGHGRVLASPAIGPRDRQLDALVARGDAHLAREPSDRRRRNAGDRRRPLGRTVRDALLQELVRGLDGAAVGQRELAVQKGVGALGVRRHRPVRVAVPPHRVAHVLRRAVGTVRKDFTADEQPGVVGVGVDVHELPGVRVAREEVAIVEAELDQLAAEREQQRAVGAGADRHPFVGDRRVAGADRIDRHEATAVALELRDRDLERIRVMVLGRADHHEELRAVEIGRRRTPRTSRRSCRSCPAAMLTEQKPPCAA